MIQVRTVFQAHFGKAGELAKAMKASMATMAGERGARWAILTDLSGPFDTVVMEVQVESLAEWERARKEMFEDPKWREGFQRTAGLVQSGRSEYYTIEGEG